MFFSYLPFILITILYFLVALVKPHLAPHIPFRLCAICVAVSGTWGFLVILWLLGFPISPTTLGILMGMSVVGIMYALERLYTQKKIKNFWLVRLVVVIGGYYVIMALLQRQWGFFILVIILMVFGVSIPSFLFQGITHEDVLKEQARSGRKESILHKLDNCC